ncbi:hypothetical protein HPP92_010342 [Vanilla planifolia]|uniref:Uncharacterized protein n=1 Tax=Vanilla planifolia TaxID=51239 RepID=A0A835V2D7_VANPL|nr:hypothetical protein HPP92_010342 [Vanilla planifolia]
MPPSFFSAVYGQHSRPPGDLSREDLLAHLRFVASSPGGSRGDFNVHLALCRCFGARRDDLPICGRRLSAMSARGLLIPPVRRQPLGKVNAMGKSSSSG